MIIDKKPSEGTLLSEIYLDNKPLLEYPYIKVTGWRIFYKIHDTCNGFTAKVVSFGSCPSDSEPFLGDTEILDYIEITAYFDGVRHLEIRRNDGDTAGYLYYPSGLSDVLNEINKLQDKYCSKGQYDLC